MKEAGRVGTGLEAFDLPIFGAFGGEMLVVAVGERRRNISSRLCVRGHTRAALGAKGLEF